MKKKIVWPPNVFQIISVEPQAKATALQICDIKYLKGGRVKEIANTTYIYN